MSGQVITVPRPHVPHGPVGVPEDKADADYLRSAVRNIDFRERGERLWGSNLTATIRKLLLDAADAIEAAQAVPVDGVALAHPGLVEWLARGERGLSSEAIVEQLLLGGGGDKFPVDPGDFRRCELLLRAVPTLRPLLPRMAKVGPEWAALVKRWPDIVAAMDAEVPGWTERRRSGGAWRAYALINECLAIGDPS